MTTRVPKQEALFKAKRMPRVNEKKKEGFAIGVSAEHYWVITAMAKGQESNRMQILEQIIDAYIHEVLSKVKA